MPNWPWPDPVIHSRTFPSAIVVQPAAALLLKLAQSVVPELVLVPTVIQVDPLYMAISEVVLPIPELIVGAFARFEGHWTE